MKNGLDEQYIDLLKDILENGVEKDTRNGKTISVFGRQIRYKFKDGKFPLLTTKKMYWKGIVTELLWFLRGSTNIKYLLENNCHIWTGDAIKNYEKHNGEINGGPHTTKQEYFEDCVLNKEGFAKKWGSLGKIYGHGWRNWNGKSDDELYEEFLQKLKTDKEFNDEFVNKGIDQIQNLIEQLKTNPDSRRLMVSAWNPSDLPHQVLPPCHYGFQVYTRELSMEEKEEWCRNNSNHMDCPMRTISLMFNMRSNDVPLGLPFNIASYGLLLEIIGRMVNMVPDELIANLGDAHIYKNQINGVKEQLTRDSFKLPNLIISDGVNFNGTIDEFLESCNINSFKLNGYESHPSIKMPLSN